MHSSIVTCPDHDLTERMETRKPPIPGDLQWCIGNHKQRLNKRKGGNGCVILQRLNDRVIGLGNNFVLDDKSGD